MTTRKRVSHGTWAYKPLRRVVRRRTRRVRNPKRRTNNPFSLQWLFGRNRVRRTR